MDYEQVIKELKSLGTEQNRKVYKRHGVRGAMYGVSYANLEKLRKKIKMDHELAQKLWRSGNHDARILATMVLDPSRLTNRVIDTWAKDLDNYVITDALSTAVGKSAAVRKKMEQWTRSKDEWKGSAGWSLLSRLAMDDDTLRNEDFTRYLSTIEKSIHAQKNRVRYSMNNALIAMGVRNKVLQKKALSVAKKIGTVEVDHGETNCKTPDAASYIQKTAARKKRRATKAAKR